MSIFDAQADAGGVDDVQPVYPIDGRLDIGLDGKVGHDDQRDRTLLGRIVAGIVLDHAGDADPLLAQDLGEPSQDAGPIGDREAEVISAADVDRGTRPGRPGRLPTRGSAAATGDRPGRSRPGSGRRRPPRPSASRRRHGRRRAYRPRHRRPRGWRCTGRGPPPAGVPWRTSVGRHAELQPGGREPRQRQELDRVAELAGVLEVGALEPIDALAGDLVKAGRLPRRRAAPGSPACAPCRCRRRRGSGRPRRSPGAGPGAGPHRRAGPRVVIRVRMKLQVPLTIAARLWIWLAASATPSAWTIGIPPADARLERHRPTRRPGLGRRPAAVLRQQGLVGGDDVLARPPGGRRVYCERRVRTAHRLDDDIDLGILDEPLRPRS